jgi:hypothetical protein
LLRLPDGSSFSSRADGLFFFVSRRRAVLFGLAPTGCSFSSRADGLFFFVSRRRAGQPSDIELVAR